MVHNGVQPHNRIYNTLIHGFLTSGQLKEAFRLLKVMRSQGVLPNVVTWNSVMSHDLPLQGWKSQRSCSFFFIPCL
uniref:Pentatricopeptide repeat-containing protein n=1 Tax=Aegilops tauschii subsp. strangulata TaxID=200361 RepID=A0A453N6A6_AEGTS